jgi:hypothetical protein
MAFGVFLWFSGFIFMQENGHKIKWYFKVYFNEGKRPKIKTISSRRHLSEWFWAHACAKNQRHSLPGPLVWLLTHTC